MGDFTFVGKNPFGVTTKIPTNGWRCQTDLGSIRDDCASCATGPSPGSTHAEKRRNSFGKVSLGRQTYVVNRTWPIVEYSAVTDLHRLAETVRCHSAQLSVLPRKPSKRSPDSFPFAG